MIKIILLISLVMLVNNHRVKEKQTTLIQQKLLQEAIASKISWVVAFVFNLGVSKGDFDFFSFDINKKIDSNLTGI